MRETSCVSWRWLCLLFVFFSNARGASQSTGTGSASTCPFRTVNYITHSLPQQCHKSSWSSPAPSATVETSPSLSGRRSPDATDHTTSVTAEAIPETSESFPSLNAQPSLMQKELLTQATASSASQEATESDSGDALGNTNFLSFEEWKEQNLAKLGQAEPVGKKHSQPIENRKRPSNIHTALDSLGDDAEIDLNFGAFSAERPEYTDSTLWGKTAEDTVPEEVDDGLSPRAKLRNRDAGTTCKERFNYASFDCAATVLKTNPQASGAVSVLIEKNKDSYMLNECSADNKFIILELCDDIAIDTVVLANFEFFSSTFRTFKVSVSDRYPVKLDKWKTLGTYEARNSREIQAFLVENPLIWARYLRIEFLTHYGHEFYCPLSLVRVHGTTMMEDYKHDEGTLKSDDDDEEEGTLEEEAGEKITPDALAQPILEELASKSRAAVEVRATQEATSVATASSEEMHSTAEPDVRATSPYNPSLLSADVLAAIFETPVGTCATDQSPTSGPQSTSVSSEIPVEVTTTTVFVEKASDDIPGMSVSATTSFAAPEAELSAASNERTSSDDEIHAVISPSRTTTSSKSAHHTSPESTKAGSTLTQPHPANPTIQESFFKSVQKRLQMLESNSSLSLQYIEEQSRILREAFSKVEQKQVAKTTGFLDYLNSTVLNELRDFRQQYDQIWQSTVIELETQREQYQHEVLAVNTRLGILADEIIFQKRMSMLQSFLVLLCLGLVLFSRGALHSYLELPIVQNAMARSRSFRMSPVNDTPGGSPPESSFATTFRSKAGRGILRRYDRETSHDIRLDGSVSPEIAYSPPTPTSQYDESEAEQTDAEAGRASSPVPSFETIERPRSSPGVLTSVVNTPPIHAIQMNGHAVRSVPSMEPLDTALESPLSLEEDVSRSPVSLTIPRI